MLAQMFDIPPGDSVVGLDVEPTPEEPKVYVPGEPYSGLMVTGVREEMCIGAVMRAAVYKESHGLPAAFDLAEHELRKVLKLEREAYRGTFVFPGERPRWDPNFRVGEGGVVVLRDDYPATSGDHPNALERGRGTEVNQRLMKDLAIQTMRDLAVEVWLAFDRDGFTTPLTVVLSVVGRANHLRVRVEDDRSLTLEWAVKNGVGKKWSRFHTHVERVTPTWIERTFVHGVWT